jgi:hypothetical protein
MWYSSGANQTVRIYAPFCITATVRIQQEQESGKLLTESLAVGTSWSIENCLDISAEPPGGPGPLDGPNRRKIAEKLLWWLQLQNILVWVDGLELMWNSPQSNWYPWPRQTRHWGPGLDSMGRINRGPVRLYAVMPVTSVKTHVFFYQSLLPYIPKPADGS